MQPIDRADRILAYGTMRRRRGRRLLILWLVLSIGTTGILVFRAVPLMLRRPSVDPAKSALMDECERKLAIVHRALMAYANTHGGNLPETLEHLYRAGLIDRQSLTPPKHKYLSKDLANVGPHTLQLTTDANRPYVYRGAGLNIETTVKIPILFDPCPNRLGTGGTNSVYVLYLSGYIELEGVEWLEKDIGDSRVLPASRAN
jgi:hypothetical protein